MGSAAARRKILFVEDEAALHLGHSAYLVQPFDLNELAKRIDAAG